MYVCVCVYIRDVEIIFGIFGVELKPFLQELKVVISSDVVVGVVVFFRV